MRLSIALPAAANAPELGVTVSRWIEAHGPSVHRTMRRLGVPESHLEDALQIVFLTAVRRFADIEPGSERAFLFRVAVHTAAHVRRGLARRREDPSDVLDETSSPVPSPEDSLEGRRMRAILDGLLDALPEDLRVPFVLHEIEGLASPAIAEVLGIPTGTVASRLRRARERFATLAAAARARHERGGRP
jgi:RNA polymerase sigma-70 factor (ECF subfamily)